MTKEKILRYAFIEAVNIWAKEKQYADEAPCELTKARELLAWEDAEEIGRMLREEEQKAKGER